MISSFDQILQECTEPWELRLDKYPIHELKQLEVLIFVQETSFLQDRFIRLRFQIDDAFSMILDLFQRTFLLWLLFLFIDGLILFSDIFDELDDGLVVEVINAVLITLILLEEGIVSEEGAEKLCNTVLDDHLLEDLADNQLGYEFHISHNVFLDIVQVSIPFLF